MPPIIGRLVTFFPLTLAVCILQAKIIPFQPAKCTKHIDLHVKFKIFEVISPDPLGEAHHSQTSPLGASRLPRLAQGLWPLNRPTSFF